jgi:hypothetical protein
MHGESLNRWLSFGANTGVLIGLLLVAIEINQANITARAEMAASFQDRWVDIDISWQESEFAKTLAKSLAQPDELTTSEILQLNGFMWTFVDHLGNYKFMWDLGIFGPPQETFEQTVIDVADIYFGSAYGRAWYEENRESIGPTTVEILDNHLENLGSHEYLDQFQRIRDRASSLTED